MKDGEEATNQELSLVPREKAPWEREQSILDKIQEETDPSFGCIPGKRSLDQHVRFGLINLDKPSGPSSHEVVAWVEKMLGLKHAGHGGTLEACLQAGETQWSPACYH